MGGGASSPRRFLEDETLDYLGAAGIEGGVGARGVFDRRGLSK